MRSKIPFSTAKHYLLGLATSGVFMISGLYYFRANDNKTVEPPATAAEFVTAESPGAVKITTSFDPNALSAEDWQELGFTERQAGTILKYKSVLGGAFTSKAQLAKCYAISAEKFSELEPYLLLPESGSESKNTYRNSYPSYQNRTYSAKSFYKQLSIKGKFNPDNYSADDFVQMGFSERQAESILKYKRFLGGSFVSKEKFKQCFIISDAQYRQMAPYLLLPEGTPEKTAVKVVPKPAAALQPFDPNATTVQDWINLGFTERQAQVIINYRDRNLKGRFKSVEDVGRCFVISEEKFQQLKPYLIISAETSVPKTAATQMNPEDYSKIDLNQITFQQLVDFGFDDRAAASLLGFRKKLGGFVTKSQMLETYNIDKALMQKLLDIAPLHTDKVEKYTLTEAPENWLKQHPYFKYYADKIIYFRLSYPNDKKILKMVNAKPEAEQKMKLYLK